MHECMNILLQLAVGVSAIGMVSVLSSLHGNGCKCSVYNVSSAPGAGRVTAEKTGAS